jgi:hypothetical protein
MSNLRGLGLAMTTYAEDNDGEYPVVIPGGGRFADLLVLNGYVSVRKDDSLPSDATTYYARIPNLFYCPVEYANNGYSRPVLGMPHSSYCYRGGAEINGDHVNGYIVTDPDHGVRPDQKDRWDWGWISGKRLLKWVATDYFYTNCHRTYKVMLQLDQSVIPVEPDDLPPNCGEFPL